MLRFPLYLLKQAFNAAREYNYIKVGDTFAQAGYKYDFDTWFKSVMTASKKKK